MSTPAFDHVSVGQGRVITQFRDAPKFNAWLAGLLDISNELQLCFETLQYISSIDQMTGYWLDVIGIIVGCNRFVPNVVLLDWFGFADTGDGSYSTCFGEEGIQNIGARFYEEKENIYNTTLLQDVEFRLFIKGRIVKNNSSCTGEDLLAGLRFIFGTDDVRLIDHGLDSAPSIGISIQVGRPIYAYEQAMITALDILPRPAGVPIVGPVTSYVPPGDGYLGGSY
jgi:hypothetical protein